MPAAPTPARRIVMGTAKDVAVFLLWNIVIGACILFFPAPIGAGLALAVTLPLIHFYLLHGHRSYPAGRWKALALRSVRTHLRGILLMVAGFVPLVWGLSELYLSYIPVPEAQLNPFEWLTRTPEGRFTLAVLAVGMAPVVEEFFFRGLIQSRLSGRFGAAAGILIAAALFAAVHMLVWIFPVHFLLGAAFGLAVWASGSIWTGVILHAVNNMLALLGMGLGEHFESPETGTGPGDMLAWYLLAAVAGGAIFLWTCRNLYRETRAPDRGDGPPLPPPEEG